MAGSHALVCLFTWPMLKPNHECLPPLTRYCQQSQWILSPPRTRSLNTQSINHRLLTWLLNHETTLTVPNANLKPIYHNCILPFIGNVWFGPTPSSSVLVENLAFMGYVHHKKNKVLFSFWTIIYLFRDSFPDKKKHQKSHISREFSSPIHSPISIFVRMYMYLLVYCFAKLILFLLNSVFLFNLSWLN